jgi:hypothetical protein
MPLSVASHMRLALTIIAALVAVSLSAPAPLIAQPLAPLPHGDRAIDSVSKLDRHDTARLLSGAESCGHCVGIKCRTVFTLWRATRTTLRALARAWSAGAIRYVSGCHARATVIMTMR